MKTADIAWIAGLLEGEGCFSINRNTPAVIVGMTDEDVVKKVAGFFGSTLRGPQRRSSSKKDVWITSVHGSKAVSWMLTSYPLLGARRRGRIREILAIWRRAPVGQKHRTHCPKGHPYDETNTRYYHGRRHCRRCAVDHARAQRAKTAFERSGNTDAYSPRCAD